MAKKLFKIMVIGLLVKNNVVKKYGELVEESELTRPSTDLIAENFIAEATKEEVKAAEKGGKDDEIKNQKNTQINTDLKAQEEGEEKAEKQKQDQIDADLKAQEEKQKLADADQKKNDSPLDKLKK